MTAAAIIAAYLAAAIPAAMLVGYLIRHGITLIRYSITPRDWWSR